ncbi:hypothetical protein IEQ34_016407 [Dendrobium chrysotoxum]|uniref:Uncharacterized protein n=1 Tax=Dendrobium chrysotoxum TaxID=161865 RepID=A0AAV7GFH6_DENCH|nr:hypothetical protein IEQ34_016407 [Dendrobium chrysotoxum]
MNPVTRTAPSRMRKSSGVRRELVAARLLRTNISIQNGLAKRETEAEPSLPREMLALMASLRDRELLFCFAEAETGESFKLCHER